MTSGAGYGGRAARLWLMASQMRLVALAFQGSSMYLAIRCMVYKSINFVELLLARRAAMKPDSDLEPKLYRERHMIL